MTIYYGDFKPNQIRNNVFWFDAADETTITKNVSNKISQWDDKSGNNLFFSQSNLGNQPIYNENFLNNKSTINFTSSTLHRLNLNLADIPQPWAIYFVVNGINMTAFAKSQLIDSATNIILYEQGLNTGKLGFTNIGNPSQSFNINTPYNTWKIISFAGFSGKIWAFMDAQSSFVSFNYSMPARSLRIFEGNIAEIIAYDTTLTLTENTQILNYLGIKWGF